MKLFGLKKPADVAANELREAHLQLLQAEAAAEHYKHTTAMLRERIKRLECVVSCGPVTYLGAVDITAEGLPTIQQPRGFAR